MRHKNGQWMDILSRANVVFDEDGTAVRVVGTHVDITGRNNAIREKEALEKQLYHARKMESIGNLAGGIAHDFNNLLFPIIGMAELLMEDLPQGSQLHDNAHEIFNAGVRGSDLVKQILAFSRQTGHELRPLNMERVVREALKLCRATVPADIAIHQEIQKGGRGCHVRPHTTAPGGPEPCYQRLPCG